MGGPHDAAMAEPHSWWGDGINRGINRFTEWTGYDTRRVTDVPGGPKDNPFYRDNAQHMPGWGNTFGLDFMDPHGLPSGATAQDRATNYVGHRDDHGIWGDVRQRLVQNEQGYINQLPVGPDGQRQGNISFGQVYNAHVDAYSDAQAAARAEGRGNGAANSFVDPASFALAMYGAPLMEHFGINAGPITGASIDYFNDPTDTATEGWAKRMGLAGAEIGTGALMMSNPITFLPGLATAGLGVFGGVWNTATAIGNGMLGEWGEAIGDGARAVGRGISSGARAVGRGISSAASTVGSGIATGARAVGNAASTVGHGIADAGRSAWNTAGNVASSAWNTASDVAGRAGTAVSGAASSAWNAVSDW